MRESDIEQHLVNRVKDSGGEVRKVSWIGRRGAPDRLVMLPGKWLNGSTRRGKTIWVELKAPGKVAEPHQLREHTKMRNLGQTVLVIDSKDAVDELFDGLP